MLHSVKPFIKIEENGNRGFRFVKVFISFIKKSRNCITSSTFMSKFDLTFIETVNLINEGVDTMEL